MGRWVFIISVALSSVALSGQVADPAFPILEKAYAALRVHDYDSAIAAFAQAIPLAPTRTSIHKDLAYTLLKTGETEAARDEFAAAMSLDPADDHVALEYAFLCHETKQTAVGRRIFDRVRMKGDATAAAAYENVDRPLREGIQRWTHAVEIDPANFSAHEELARLADQRDEFALAAEHYEKAWRLRPDRRALLLDLARMWQAANRNVDALAALLAASRGPDPRTAEDARELLPTRYPFVYEFEQALKLDSSNADLRRELAYLHLEMDHRRDAEKLFEQVVEQSPDDLLSTAQLGFLRRSRGDEKGALPLLNRVLAGSDDELSDRVRIALKMPPVLHKQPEAPRNSPGDAKKLGEKSLEKGDLKDALKYLRAAHENDPVDFAVMLKLGWAYNLLKEDEEAARWFNLARRSPDRSTATEANRAYQNLRPTLERFRSSLWIFPMFSTRWHDLFSYAQAKTELRLSGVPLRPYVSVRFIGDVRGAVGLGASIGPQYLSERSVILAAGLATLPWHGITGWFEAGEALRYRVAPNDAARAVPDYRGGVAYGKGFGALLAKEAHGAFGETNLDGIYVSRFANDMLLYSQSRFGYTWAGCVQALWNWNATVDSRGEYWANYVETGPGVKLRVENLPLVFSASALRGMYLVTQGNPRGPNYYDLRIGVWYAISH
jgi:Tfp pilus assembly protein PilF